MGLTSCMGQLYSHQRFRVISERDDLDFLVERLCELMKEIRAEAAKHL